MAYGWNNKAALRAVVANALDSCFSPNSGENEALFITSSLSSFLLFSSLLASVGVAISENFLVMRLFFEYPCFSSPRNRNMINLQEFKKL